MATSLYYYVISSLPLIDLNSELTMTYEEFLDICKSSLSDEDYAVLCEAKFGSFEYTSSCFLNHWIDYDVSLRNSLVELRKPTVSFDGDYKRGEITDFQGQQNAKVAFGKTSLTEAEHFLNKSRWDFIENMESGLFFSLENLVAYSLKLQILSRMKSLSKEKGQENFNRIYDEITKKINEKQN